jgi:polar amino acid transport system substrate-binding protein
MTKHLLFRFNLTVAIAIGWLITTAAAQDAPALGSAELLKPGTIQFAADFAAAPNQFIRTDGVKDGLNVDLCSEIAKRLNLEIAWTNLAFPGLVPGLQGKRFDALCTAIFVTPEREKIMNMVTYVQWGEGLMVPTDNPLAASCAAKSGDDASYKDCFDKLAGKTIAVAAAGTTNKNLVAQSDRIKSEGKTPITVRAFDSNSEAIQAVVSGQADAGYLNDPQAHFFINQNPGRYRMSFEGFRSNRLALATLKDNMKLSEALVWALGKMKADGTYNAILKKWGVAAVPDFAINP